MHKPRYPRPRNLWERRGFWYKDARYNLGEAAKRNWPAIALVMAALGLSIWFACAALANTPLHIIGG